jgi:integrase
LNQKWEDRKYGLHILRHTAATVLHEQTGDIEVAQRALGEYQVDKRNGYNPDEMRALRPSMWLRGQDLNLRHAGL